MPRSTIALRSASDLLEGRRYIGATSLDRDHETFLTQYRNSLTGRAASHFKFLLYCRLTGDRPVRLEIARHNALSYPRRYL